MARWSPQVGSYARQPSAFERALEAGAHFGQQALAGFERGRAEGYGRAQDRWRAELIERDRTDRQARERQILHRQEALDALAAEQTALSRALAGLRPATEVAEPGEEIEGFGRRWEPLGGTGYLLDRQRTPAWAAHTEAERRRTMGGLFDTMGGVGGEAAFPYLEGDDASRLLSGLLDEPREHRMLTERERVQQRFAPASAADPPAERRSREQGARDAQSRVDQQVGERRRVLGTRPHQRTFTDPLTLRPDTAAFGEALRNWRADSTFIEGQLRGAQEDLGYARSLLRPGDRGYQPPDSLRLRR